MKRNTVFRKTNQLVTGKRTFKEWDILISRSIYCYEQKEFIHSWNMLCGGEKLANYLLKNSPPVRKLITITYKPLGEICFFNWKNHSFSICTTHCSKVLRKSNEQLKLQVFLKSHYWKHCQRQKELCDWDISIFFCFLYSRNWRTCSFREFLVWLS